MAFATASVKIAIIQFPLWSVILITRCAPADFEIVSHRPRGKMTRFSLLIFGFSSNRQMYVSSLTSPVEIKWYNWSRLSQHFIWRKPNSGIEHLRSSCRLAPQRYSVCLSWFIGLDEGTLALAQLHTPSKVILSSYLFLLLLISNVLFQNGSNYQAAFAQIVILPPLDVVLGKSECPLLNV